MKKSLLFISILCLCVFDGMAQIERIVWRRSNKNGGGYIYSMLPDGTDVKNLSGQEPVPYGYPVPSPDGSKIIFVFGAELDIYSMNADGTNVTNVSKSLPNFYMTTPAWSPDGSKIIFTYFYIMQPCRPFCVSEYFIGVMNAEGGIKVPLVLSNSYAPSWSSANKIAFTSNQTRLGEYWHIYTVDPDGSNQQQLTFGNNNNRGPKWSPDGSKIAFTSDKGGITGAYIMNADGSNLVLVKENVGGPIWSADGTRLLVSAGGGYTPGVGYSDAHIYIMNIDGSNLTRVIPDDDADSLYYDQGANWLTIAIPPVALAGTTPAVTSTSALVNGIISANGAATAVFFQYSTDPSMATGVIEVAATPDSLGAFNNNNVPASASLANLVPNTTYYYRLKGVNSKGTALGPIQSFLTTVQGLPLPVLLVSYEAQVLAGNQVKLSWRTAQESNNSHFVIEKSTDGILFTPIGRVEGKGNSTTITDYTFTDGSFTTATAFYRLKQVDRDGRFTESGIRKVNENSSYNRARLYPNPVTNNFFTVETGATLPVKYKIVNITGRQVQEGLLKKTKEELNISAIPKGYYMLRLSNGNTMTFRKD